jgi:hypothetical protein
VQQGDKRPTLPIRESDKDFRLQEYRRLRVENVVVLAAAEDEAKRYERFTVQKFADVISDHAEVIS